MFLKRIKFINKNFIYFFTLFLISKWKKRRRIRIRSGYDKTMHNSPKLETLTKNIGKSLSLRECMLKKMNILAIGAQ